MFNPNETIEKLEALIVENKEAENVEIPLEDVRKLLNDFLILKHQADSLISVLGELKDLADQGKLIRISDKT
ncbi:hypothetical protein [Paenibacillus sp. 481]|uniref:hypothetical protein n=1 Tax=Paenibacillus sp. 481 TaxID=2835869 RepID=UPI001E54837E|nr:hypothetical protein [Paenibacillus sp. 481]UHA74443.1 hypothetical protein KIK04_04870 [Paenibacillus sp. 481]